MASADWGKHEKKIVGKTNKQNTLTCQPGFPPMLMRAWWAHAPHWRQPLCRERWASGPWQPSHLYQKTVCYRETLLFSKWTQTERSKLSILVPRSTRSQRHCCPKNFLIQFLIKMGEPLKFRKHFTLTLASRLCQTGNIKPVVHKPDQKCSEQPINSIQLVIATLPSQLRLYNVVSRACLYQLLLLYKCVRLGGLGWREITTCKANYEL